MKIPGYESAPFRIEEFVPKVIFSSYGTKSIWFMDYDVVDSMVWLRKWFDAPITINNYHSGGSFQNRGFRMPTSTVGAKLSQHKFGRAIDFNVKGLTSNEVAKRISDNWDEIQLHVGFTTMENPSDTPGWTHMDKRWTGLNDLLIVNG